MTPSPKSNAKKKKVLCANGASELDNHNHCHIYIICMKRWGPGGKRLKDIPAHRPLPISIRLYGARCMYGSMQIKGGLVVAVGWRRIEIVEGINCFRSN